MKKSLALTICCAFFLLKGYAQVLKPGFDKNEYISLMKVSAQFGDSAYAARIPPPTGYSFVYRSPVMGLENRWDLWRTNEGVPVISIRGTTQKEISWLENFYAAMVPAKGALQLTKSENFSYQLSENPRAAVHVGWLIGMSFLSKDILPKIDSSYKNGARNFYIMGHSQGGAIAFLLTAYVHQLQKQNKLPSDIRFKTYCSAAPKPGNLYFAYEYEAMTQGGWAYNVVNAEDWVPQTPFSVQTVDDLVDVSPFSNVSSVIKKNKWPKRIVLNYAYGQLSKPSKKAQRNYQKYLGRYVSKSIKKALPGFEPPTYFNSNDYVRTGFTITLLPGPDYFEEFPRDKTKVFGNHLHAAYLYLSNQLNMGESLVDRSPLDGTWELTSLNGQSIAELYPNKKPALQFDTAANKFGGNTSCNNFNGALQYDDHHISFPASMAMTKMMCPGNGEQAFIEALRKSNTYRIETDKLILLSNNETVMELERK